MRQNDQITNLKLQIKTISSKSMKFRQTLRTHRPHRLVSGRLGSGLRWGTDSHVTTNPLVLKTRTLCGCGHTDMVLYLFSADGRTGTYP